MDDLEDFVALSFLSLSCRRQMGEGLRGNVPPGQLVRLFASNRTAGSGMAQGVATALARASRHGLTPVAWNDPRYPTLLGAIPDPPPVLWARGDMLTLDAPSFAIVGSRSGSPYALSVAERLAGDLASLGVTIVSGLARGVDSAAHRGALAIGRTVAVLGSGADVIYPPEHRQLADDIVSSGALLSELAPGVRPRKMFFPLRNRLISGLSRAVIVVEAGEKSGSLITARSALEQGRDVLAVPGNVLSDRNRGGHALLRDGARLVESARDVLEELGLQPSNPKPGRPASNQLNPALDDPLLAVLGLGEPCDLDAMAERSGLAISKLLPRLMELELAGLVARAGGGRFVRI